MIAVGVAVLVFYALAAFVLLELLVWLWDARPDTGTLLAWILLAVVLAGAFSYWFGTLQLLSALNAVPLDRREAPRTHALLDRLCERMDVDRPELRLAWMDVPNALALGGAGSGVLVIDRQLFRLLTAEELAALLAHELAHLESRDSLVQTLAYTTGRTLVSLLVLALLPVLLLLAGVSRGWAWIRGRPTGGSFGPVEAARRGVAFLVAFVLVALTLLVRAHSRRREYAADDRAVEVTGDPLALASALRKIERASMPGWSLHSTLYVHGDDEGPLTRLLSTHPPMDDRIARLVERANRVEGSRDPPPSGGSGGRRTRIE